MDKKIVIGVIVAILLVAAFLVVKNSRGDNISGAVINEENVKNLHEVTLAIGGMSCQGCAYGVKAQLEQLEGVVSADINYEDGSGVVRYDADKVNPEEIADASTAYPIEIIEDRIIN
jgi:copper chaperone CopZ